MAELCIPDGLGHPIINPFGEVILISQSALRDLDIRGYLHRDQASGLKGMDPAQYLIFVESERGTYLFYEIGENCSGPNVVTCNCDDCKARIVDEAECLIRDVRTRQAVNN
jgi:hypothetical protein